MTDKRKLTILLYDAVRTENNLSYIEKLLKDGALPNCLVPDATALHIAPGIEDLDKSEAICKLLLSYGANPNLKNSDGLTPLHVACLFGRCNCVKLFLQNGGDPTIQSQDGQDCIDLAESSGCSDCVSLVKQHLQQKDKNVVSNANPSSQLPEGPRKILPDLRKSILAKSIQTRMVKEELDHQPKLDTHEVSKEDVTEEAEAKDVLHVQELDPSILAKFRLLTTISEESSSPQSDYSPNSESSFWLNVQNQLSKEDRAVITRTSDQTNIEDRVVTETSLDQTNHSPVFTGVQTNHRNKLECVNKGKSEVGVNNSPAALKDVKKTATMTKVQVLVSQTNGYHKEVERLKTLQVHITSSPIAGKGAVTDGASADACSDWSNNNGACSNLTTDDLRVRIKTAQRIFPGLDEDSFSDATQEEATAHSGNINQSVVQLENGPSSDVATPSSSTYSEISSPSPPQEFYTEDESTLACSDMRRYAVRPLAALSEAVQVPVRKVHPAFYDSPRTSSPKDEPRHSSAVPSYLAVSKQAVNSTQLAAQQAVNLQQPKVNCPQWPGIGAVVNKVYCDNDDTLPLLEAYLPTDSSGQSTPGSSYTEVNAAVRTAIEGLTDERLRQRLRDYGEEPGPVNAGTRSVYVAKLAKLISDGQSERKSRKKKWCPELQKVLDEGPKAVNILYLEKALAQSFDTPRKTPREGNSRTSFVYLLLDPKLTDNLPLRVRLGLGELEGFAVFLDSVFYIGKGKRSRPDAHFKEALQSVKQSAKHRTQVAGADNQKINRILDIWRSGYGVVTLEVFHRMLPAEAFTREACMISAMGVPHLTNKIAGNVYGVASEWPLKLRQRFGAATLYQAYMILIQAGERHVRPADLG